MTPSQLLTRLRGAGWNRARSVLWYLGQPLLRASLRVARFYRPSFHETSPLLYGAADRLGIYPVIDHYHEPMIAPSAHLGPAVGDPRNLPGLDLAIERQLELLAGFHFQDELAAIPSQYVDLVTPYYDNVSFARADAQMLHNMIRHFQPSQIIEIGSGETSRFAARALRLNGNAPPSAGEGLTCVEPYEAPWLEALGLSVIRRKVEDLPLSHFDSLGPSDILFIDSSHVIRAGGDVLYLYNEVIPRLQPGVIVHVHDIFTPRHYPRQWMEKRWLWDEQYLVEAMLTKCSWLEILVTVNHLFCSQPAELEAACPGSTTVSGPQVPGSLWLRTVG